MCRTVDALFETNTFLYGGQFSRNWHDVSVYRDMICCELLVCVTLKIFLLLQRDYIDDVQLHDPRTAYQRVRSGCC